MNNQTRKNDISRDSVNNSDSDSDINVVLNENLVKKFSLVLNDMNMKKKSSVYSNENNSKVDCESKNSKRNKLSKFSSVCVSRDKSPNNYNKKENKKLALNKKVIDGSSCTLPNRKIYQEYESNFKRSNSDNFSKNNESGAIKKQISVDETMYRNYKRRYSYLMATQNESNIFKKNITSYVNRRIAEIEKQDDADVLTVIDLKSQSNDKYKEDIKKLLNKYNEGKKANKPNAMTRDTLNSEIDKVLFSKFTQLSCDTKQEVSEIVSPTTNRSNLQSVNSDCDLNTESDEIITLVVDQNEETAPEAINPKFMDPDYLIIIRENSEMLSNNELSTQIDEDKHETINNSDNLNSDEIPKRKVSNLIDYFTEKITENEKSRTSSRNKSSNDNYDQELDDLKENLNRISQDVDKLIKKQQLKSSNSGSSSSYNDVFTEDDVPKPRKSLLYSRKFSRINSTQDTNNNVQNSAESNQTRKSKLYSYGNSAIYDIRTSGNDEENDIENVFISDSESEHYALETKNEKHDSVSSWVESTLEETKRSNQEEDIVDYQINEKTESLESLDSIYETINLNQRLSLEYIDNDCDIESSEKRFQESVDEIKQNSRKTYLVNELISTEKNYIYKFLHRIVFDYMTEMEKENTPKFLVGKTRVIFGNVDIIYHDHKQKFLPDLQKFTCYEDIGNCFLKHESIFKLYPLYSKNKPKSDQIMQDYGNYFKSKQEELNDKLNLASYLLSPIQRLGKYCLLVENLVRECEKDNTPCEKLKRASNMLNKQINLSNDLIALDAITNFNGNIRELGDLLLRDTFLVQQRNKKPFNAMVFLFQESLVITAIIKNETSDVFEYRENFALTDIGYTDYENEPYAFGVWFRRRNLNMYTLKAKFKDVKQKWVKEIYNLLWKQLEANRREQKQELLENGVTETRVPLEKPPTESMKKYKKRGSSSTRSRKKYYNSVWDTVWYTESS